MLKKRESQTWQLLQRSLSVRFRPNFKPRHWPATSSILSRACFDAFLKSGSVARNFPLLHTGYCCLPSPIFPRTKPILSSAHPISCIVDSLFLLVETLLPHPTKSRRLFMKQNCILRLIIQRVARFPRGREATPPSHPPPGLPPKKEKQTYSESSKHVVPHQCNAMKINTKQ